MMLLRHAETLSMSVLSKTPCNMSSQSYSLSSVIRIYKVSSKLIELSKLNIPGNIFLFIESVKLVPHVSSDLLRFSPAEITFKFLCTRKHGKRKEIKICRRVTGRLYSNIQLNSIAPHFVQSASVFSCGLAVLTAAK